MLHPKYEAALNIKHTAVTVSLARLNEVFQILKSALMVDASNGPKDIPRVGRQALDNYHLATEGLAIALSELIDMQSALFNPPSNEGGEGNVVHINTGKLLTEAEAAAKMPPTSPESTVH